MPGGVTLPEQTRDWGGGSGESAPELSLPGTEALSQSPRLQRGGNTSSPQEVRDSGSRNLRHRKQGGTVKGEPLPTGVDTILETFTAEVLSEESSQGVSTARESAHSTAGGWGVQG